MITRKIDELGRIVIPREIIKNMNWKIKAPGEIGTELEFVINGKEILMREFGGKCNCCSNDPITEVQGVKLCGECIQAFNNARELLRKVIG